jgi:hypothetical protein
MPRPILILTALALSLGPAHAQQTTLTLACKGVTWDNLGASDKREPVSMGIVVNFTTRTVLGGFNTRTVQGGFGPRDVPRQDNGC